MRYTANITWATEVEADNPDEAMMIAQSLANYLDHVKVGFGPDAKDGHAYADTIKWVDPNGIPVTIFAWADTLEPGICRGCRADTIIDKSRGRLCDGCVEKPKDPDAERYRSIAVPERTIQDLSDIPAEYLTITPVIQSRCSKCDALLSANDLPFGICAPCADDELPF